VYFILLFVFCDEAIMADVLAETKQKFCEAVHALTNYIITSEDLDVMKMQTYKYVCEHSWAHYTHHTAFFEATVLARDTFSAISELEKEIRHKADSYAKHLAASENSAFCQQMGRSYLKTYWKKSDKAYSHHAHSLYLWLYIIVNRIKQIDINTISQDVAAGYDAFMCLHAVMTLILDL
jgi:hypothetical protein